MTNKTSLFLILTIASILLTSPLAMDDVFADKDDDKNKKDKDDKNDNNPFKALWDAIAELQAQSDSFFDIFTELQATDTSLQSQIDVLSTAGTQGPSGNDGLNGLNGISCWDLNENGSADFPDEDVNGDSTINVLDCKGPKGDKGDTGGPAGTSSTRTIHTVDDTQKFPQRTALFPIMSQSFTTSGNSEVFTEALILSSSDGGGWSEIVLVVDDVIVSRALDHMVAGSWESQSLGWAGTLPAGSHTISVKTAERAGDLAADRYCGLNGGCVINTLLTE